jgi:hypothetical protein
MWVQGSIGKGILMPRVKLTKRVIDALPTASKDVVFWDTESPGFGVKVRTPANLTAPISD